MLVTSNGISVRVLDSEFEVESEIIEGVKQVMEICIPPDEGGRSRTEHAMAQVVQLSLRAYLCKKASNQLDCWKKVLHEVQGVVDALELDTELDGKEQQP